MVPAKKDKEEEEEVRVVIFIPVVVGRASLGGDEKEVKSFPPGGVTGSNAAPAISSLIRRSFH